tara:strand:+ start:1966 stop:3423 length:1458 start_codon:yes stop_codon:yes gene_type:complete
MNVSKPVIFGIVFASFSVIISLPEPAYAHGFGERYDLPIPLEIYFLGAGISISATFIFLLLFLQKGFSLRNPHLDVSSWFFVRNLHNKIFMLLAKTTSVFLFFTIVIAGFIGDPDPVQNIAPTFIWIIFWVGAIFFIGFVGDVWKLINPWLIIHEVIDSISRKYASKEITRNAQYPPGLSSWPAVGIFFIFAWIENVWINASDPFSLSVIITIYTLFTLTGMFFFNPKIWLKNCEPLSMILGFFARLAFCELRWCNSKPQVFLKFFGTGLIKKAPPTFSQGIFIILVLSTVSFDGFSETGLWSKFFARSYDSFAWLGTYAYSGIRTIGLICAPFVLGSVFFLAIGLSKKASRSNTKMTTLIAEFSVSLLPIAFAYHVAHYFSYLLIQGQRIIALASDPFGWGWDVFGTADYKPDITIIDAKFAWILGLFAIIIGHVIATYAAHIIASKKSESQLDILRTQSPILILMIGYTIVSLWILAQPIVSH